MSNHKLLKHNCVTGILHHPACTTFMRVGFYCFSNHSHHKCWAGYGKYGKNLTTM